MTETPNVVDPTNAPFFKGPFIGLPVVWDTERADQALQDLYAKVLDVDERDLRDRLQATLEDPCVGDVLRAIFSNSPFLTRCALSDLPFLRLALEQGPDTGLCHVIDEIKDELSREVDADRLKRGLRIARKRAALLVALADITGTWSLERVTQALSDFADAATSAALSHLLLVAAENNEIVLIDDYFPEYECGYFALAMGKYGARELNYSSDIDLIILYDPIKIDYRGRRSIQQFLAQLTRTLVSVLQEPTPDGYVFRVDLRLRPDPGSTPAAIPYANALGYYESRGAGWERAAMIKARPAVGDLALGRQFLGELEPFVWRPAVDFWAQREMAKIKRQINEHRGGGEIGFHGHNIKVGRGGIREIEFFVQSHQLVYGGRDAYLRSTRTLDALSTLAEAGHVSDETADELTEAYEFLRQLEHRLQMINDQQTQILPSDDASMRHVAAFMGYEDIDIFRDTLTNDMMIVDGRFSSVFEDSDESTGRRFYDLASMDGNPKENAVLKELGFSDAKGVHETLRRWQAAAYDSIGDARSQELMNELAPRIIEVAAASYDPDFIIERFDTLLSNLKGGVRFLSTLTSNQTAFDFVLEVLGSAPNLSEELSHNPQRLQCVLSSDGFEEAPDARVLTAECTDLLKVATTREALYTSVGSWAAEQRFRIAAQIVHHTIDWTESGRAYANIADAVVQSVSHDEEHRSESGEAAFKLPVVAVGIGPYGARELTHGAPADLLFFCRDDPVEAHAIRAFCRGLLVSLTSSTPEGTLLDVNLGTTPYGTRLPIVTQTGPFLSFCEAGDSPLSMLALPQARVIFGSDPLVEEVVRDLRAFLVGGAAWHHLSGRSEEILRILRAVATIRFWDLRHRRGGLAELEALIAFLQVRAAPLDRSVLTLSCGGALGTLIAMGQLDQGLGRQLIEAHHLMRQAESFLAAATGARFEPDAAPSRVKAALARACGAERFEDLEAMLQNATTRVSESLDQILMGSA